jgi:hypothetical protein
MNFAIYIIGAILVVCGLAYGASRLGISSTWIFIGAIVIIGWPLWLALPIRGRKIRQRNKSGAVVQSCTGGDSDAALRLRR